MFFERLQAPSEVIKEGPTYERVGPFAKTERTYWLGANYVAAVTPVATYVAVLRRTNCVGVPPDTGSAQDFFAHARITLFRNEGTVTSAPNSCLKSTVIFDMKTRSSTLCRGICDRTHVAMCE